MSSLSSRAKLRESLHLRDAFVSSGIPARGVANATAFTVAQEWLRERDYVEHLRVSGRVLHHVVRGARSVVAADRTHTEVRQDGVSGPTVAAGRKDAPA